MTTTSAAFDIAGLLATQGSLGQVGTDIGVNAFMDKATNDGNEIAVFEFSGAPDDTAHGSATAFEHPRIQVQVRNISAALAFEKCYTCYAFLRGKMDQTLNTHVYQLIEAAVYPQLLQRDEQNRAIFMCELIAHRSPAA